MKQGMSGVRKIAVLLAPFLFASFLFSSELIDFAYQKLVKQNGTIDTVFFTQPEKKDNTVEKVLTGLIRSEQEKISGALFRLSNKTITHELLQAHERGVTIEIVFDPGAITTQTLKLSKEGIPLLIYDAKRFPALMHHKFLLFHNTLDKRSILSTGSLNITEAGFSANAENIMIRDDESFFYDFSEEFKRLKKFCHYLQSKIPERVVTDLEKEPIPSFVKKKSKHKKAWKAHREKEQKLRKLLLGEKVERTVQFVQRYVK